MEDCLRELNKRALESKPAVDPDDKKAAENSQPKKARKSKKVVKEIKDLPRNARAWFTVATEGSLW